jgi:4,5-dihydroxyphthalate decarboxylase
MSWRCRKGWWTAIPTFPEKLFRLYCDAKRWAQRWRRAIPSLVEAWPNHYLAEEQEIFQTDPWSYGLEANRHVLETFLGYCHAQGVTAKTIVAEDIFSSEHAETGRVIF